MARPFTPLRRHLKALTFELARSGVMRKQIEMMLDLPQQTVARWLKNEEIEPYSCVTIMKRGEIMHNCGAVLTIVGWHTDGVVPALIVPK